MQFLCGHYTYECYTWKVVEAVKTQSLDEWKFVGIHEDGKKDSDVRGLDFFGHDLSCFPKNLYKKFPNLKRLRIIKCTLKTISQDDLAGLVKLETLDLSENEIATLPDNVFQNMKCLQNINFSSNNLGKISYKVISPLRKSLITANFNNNKGINANFNKSHNSPKFDDFMRSVIRDAKSSQDWVFLSGALSVSNALQVFTLARKMKNTDTEEKAFNLIKEKYPNVPDISDFYEKIEAANNSFLGKFF